MLNTDLHVDGFGCKFLEMSFCLAALTSFTTLRSCYKLFSTKRLCFKISIISLLSFGPLNTVFQSYLSLIKIAIHAVQLISCRC